MKGLFLGSSVIALLTGSSAAIAQNATVGQENTAQQTTVMADQATAPGAAPADNGGVAEIVVTANRRSESVQRVAASISAITGDSLIRQGVTQLDDALKNIAGVTISQSPTGLSPTIRGVGPSLPNNIGGDNGISTTFDGVYNQADIAGRTGYYDVSRIEVLRGPQGTLYGRNAEGGAVNVISNNPTQQAEGSASAEYGNYNLLHFTGMANMPVSDTLALRIAGSTVNRNGYLSNGQDDNDATSVRFKALYRPDSSLSALFGAEYSKVGGKGPGTVTAFTTTPDADVAYSNKAPRNQFFRQHGYKIWSQIDADLGFATATFLPAYQRLSSPEIFAFTGLNNVSQPGDGALRQRSAELRLASDAGSPFEWIVGGYYYDNRDSTYNRRGTTLDASGNIVLTSAAPITLLTTAHSKALFAQVKVPLAETLRLVGGVRQSWDRKSQFRSNESTVTSKTDFSHFDFKLGAEFNLSTTSLVYATYATGYRPGGLSPQATKVPAGNIVTAPFPVFAAEKLTSYEIGSKNQFLDRRLTANISAYYYDYKDYQLPNLVFVPPAVNLQIISLGKVVNYGGEFELQFVPVPTDRFSFNASYIHSDIRSSQLLTFPPPAVQLKGTPLPNSPKWRLSGTYEHDFVFANGMRLSPSATVRRTTSYYITIPISAFTAQPAYWQGDASLSLSSADARWTLTGYVKNLSNEVVKSNFIGRQMTLGTPRLYGATISARF